MLQNDALSLREKQRLLTEGDGVAGFFGGDRQLADTQRLKVCRVGVSHSSNDGNDIGSGGTIAVTDRNIAPYVDRTAFSDGQMIKRETRRHAGLCPAIRAHGYVD